MDKKGRIVFRKYMGNFLGIGISSTYWAIQ